jgi:hypothetical protein
MVSALKLALGSAALCSMVLIAVHDRDPPRPPDSVASPIDERWFHEPPPAPKADRLPLMPAPVVAAAAVPVHETTEPTPSEERQQTRRERRPRATPRDICTRLGLRKVITRGGRSWRCSRRAT